MFTRLPESNARRQRRAGGFTVSTVVHVVVIALAVRATAWTAPAKAIIEPVPEVVYVEPRPEPTPRPPLTSASREATRTSTTAPAPLPPPIIPIDIVPSELPPPGAMDPLIRASDFRSNGPPLSDNLDVNRAPNVGAGAAYAEAFVDRPIVAIPGTTTPRYPSSLQSAGVEGNVRARFVVDTLGRVEPESVRILDATHDLFARAVRDALARARFAPAEARGRKVRQLAEQAFTFRLRSER